MQVPLQSSPAAIWDWFTTRAAQMVLIASTLAALGTTALSAIGSLPWLTLPVAPDGGAPLDAGPGVQIGIALLLVTLCGFLPASNRVMRLEMSHRRFHADMEDVARAYYLAHSADRQGTFRLASEFDAVRERFAFLRNHPDLSGLEPELLELAAQMSHVGRDLAEVYSDDKVAAARGLLAQRGDQASRLETDIIQATRVTRELSARLADVEDREGRAGDGIARLRTELDALLPRLNLVPKSSEGTGSGTPTAPNEGEELRDLWTTGQPPMSVVRS